MRKRSMLIVCIIMVFFCTCASAESKCSIEQLREQTPSRLCLTVTTNAGHDIVVDAPIILPKADTLPILRCKSQTFDLTHRYDYYPMKPGTATYRDYYCADSSPTATILYCVKESKGSLLRGQTDYSTRSPLAMGETPPSNDYPLNRAVEWILSNNVLFGGDEHVDLRVNRVAAMNSLCRTKPMKIFNPTTGASTSLQVADLNKPLQGGEAGLWLIEMAQYLHDTRVLSPSAVTSGMLHSDAYFCMDPTLNQCRIMNEDNFQIVLSYLKTMSVLQENSLLASWPTVEESIRQLIQHDQLKSIYQVELCYAVALSSETHDTTYETCPINAVYVLIPCWEIKGYAMNKANAANFIRRASPNSETIAMNGFGWDFRTDSYTLCLNAETGLPMQDSDLIYEVQDTVAKNDS